jgi:predicted acyl esterase
MVHVWDVHPHGPELRVADGVANRAALGERDRASGLVSLRIALSPCHHLLRAGHALALTVQSSEHPRYLPNPQTGRTLADGAPFAARVARHAVHEGQPAPSRLVLPCAGPW